MGERACAPAIVCDGHIVDSPYQLHRHAFIVIIVKSHWVIGMKHIYGLSLHPTAFKFKHGKDQARVDGIFNSEALYGFISIYPACGAKIIFKFAQVTASLLNIFLHIKISGGEGKDDFCIGHDLNIGSHRFCNAVGND